jgi:MYXO-CTERM domain-containing protein
LRRFFGSCAFVRLVRVARFACLSSLLVACSEQGAGNTVTTEGSAIVGGVPSTEEEDFVVHLRVPGANNCTGTLIAPNAVLTALHCLAEIDPFATFTCNIDGSVSSIDPGGGVFGDTFPAEEVELRVGSEPLLDPPAAYGSRIFGSGSDTVCHDDIAVVVLDRNLEPPPQRVRFGRRIVRGDYHTIIGYGQTESASVGVRHRRNSLRVLAVGEFGSYRAQGVAVPHSFVVGQGYCHGDSGGPAFDEETGAVTGVFSLLETEDCVLSDYNVATQVAPFEALVREALDHAGFEPLVEADGEGGAGAGGATNGDADAGGEAGGGTASNNGGTPGAAGGDASTGGSGTGEGGEAAASSATGGTGATAAGRPGSSAGRAGDDTGQAGADEVASQSKTEFTDAGCGCRLEATDSRRGAWAAFLSVFLVAAFRRRVR